MKNFSQRFAAFVARNLSNSRLLCSANPANGQIPLRCSKSCEVKIHEKALIKSVDRHALLMIGDHSTFILEEGAKIFLKGSFSFGRNTTIILRKNSALSLGADSWALHGCWIEAGSNNLISIGSRTTLQLRCSLHGEVAIGDDTLLAPDVFISSGGHSFDQYDNMTIREQDRLCKKSSPVVVGSNCWLGIRSWIAPGLILADGTITGANCVLTKSTDEYSVYVGVPARKIREYRSSKSGDFNHSA